MIGAQRVAFTVGPHRCALVVHPAYGCYVESLTMPLHPTPAQQRALDRAVARAAVQLGPCGPFLVIPTAVP